MSLAGRSVADANAFIRELIDDPAAVRVSPADRAMLDYALTLTRTPTAIAASDIARLRGAGFDDRAIHDICCIAAYYAFVNRLADGLGVELEQRFEGPDGEARGFWDPETR